jgi:plastocyanin
MTRGHRVASPFPDTRSDVTLGRQLNPGGTVAHLESTDRYRCPKRPTSLHAPLTRNPNHRPMQATFHHAIGLTATALAVILVGCGSGPSSPSSAPPATSPGPATETGGASGTSLQLTADPSGQLKYDKQSLTAAASKFTITLANMSPMPHDVTVAKANGEVVGATAIFTGGSKSLSLKLSPGTYEYYCSVPGHRAAGMSGTLVVK